MATSTWKWTSGTGNWSNGNNWSPAAPATGDSVSIGSNRDTGPVVVTEDYTITINSLTMAAKPGNGKNSNTTTLILTPNYTLTVSGTISLAANTIIDGAGTLIANGAISGGGTIIADNGLLNLSGSGLIASGGAVLAIGAMVPSTLELNLKIGRAHV